MLDRNSANIIAARSDFVRRGLVNAYSKMVANVCSLREAFCASSVQTTSPHKADFKNHNRQRFRMQTSRLHSASMECSIIYIF